MKPISYILHLEESQADAEVIQAKLKEEGLVCRITRVQTYDEFHAALRRDVPDIILADYRPPECDGMSALKLVRELRPEVPFIFVSGTKGEEAAIEGLTHGATNYVLKKNLSRLATTVQRALEEAGNRHERARAEAALKASEARYIDFYENAPDMYVSVNAQTELIEECNRTLADMLGLPKEEIIGRPVFNIYHPDCLEEAKGIFQEFLERGEIRDKELQLKGKDGAKIYVSLNVTSVRGDDDQILFSRSILHDITEHKRVEETLRESEERLQLAQDVAQMGLWDWDMVTGEVVWSQQCLALYGLPPDTPMSYDRFLQTLHPEDRERVDNSLQHALEERTSYDEIKRTVWPDGSIHWTNSRGKVYCDANGQPIRMIGVTFDITKWKEVEEERQAHLWVMESLDQVNQAIQGADDLEEMMKNLLDVVISIFDCDRAFLLYPCDPNSPTWTSPMERNKPEYPGVFESNLEMRMDPQVEETLRILLAADGPVTFGPGTPHALPEDAAKQFDIKCFMSMAIYPKTGLPWQFGIHQCAYVREWTTQEMKLFEAIGRRLADRLSSLLSYRDLRKNEKFLDNIVEHIPDMIFVKDAQNLSFIKFNKAGEKLLGYSREELEGRTNDDLFPKKIADLFKTRDQQVLDRREPLDIPDDTIRNTNNEERIFHSKLIPILDETGVPQYLLGISEDITEHRQVEESILKLSQAIEQSPVSIVITDTSGSIEFVNAQFTKITGYSYDEAIGQNPRILKSGETSDEEYHRLWETISSGGVWDGEFHNRKKGGELFWEHATISAVRNQYNVITHYLAVKEDITEYKKLEEQLRQSQKMEAVGQLAGGVAHDFNNMLGVIIGHAELTLEKETLDSSSREALEAILAAGRRSAEITKQLLAFARKQPIAPKILDLNEAIEMILKLLRRLIGEDIDLLWMPGANLWPVNVDPSQVNQILANLCVNARDAIDGVGKVMIETQNTVFDDAYCEDHKGFSPGEYIMLAVSDNGVGMDKPTMDKIFEPFYTTKGMGKGTGLGLSTIYGIAKQNDGFINVYSEPGNGSTFKIYLPRHAVNTEQLHRETPVAPIIQGSETILLVEDDSLVLEISKQMLEKLGYTVLTSLTPKEAIRFASEHSGEIKLLITDMIMPEMTGPDLEKKIKKLCPEIKCIFMSGYTGNVIAHQGVLDKDVNFVQKPFSMQELATKVREVLDSK